jgi:hypothetical protein
MTFRIAESPEKEERGRRNRLRVLLLKGIRSLIDVAAPEAECKTIGNGHPDGLHCFSCTFSDIRARVQRAVVFWENDDRYRDALS